MQIMPIHRTRTRAVSEKRACAYCGREAGGNKRYCSTTCANLHSNKLKLTTPEKPNDNG